jgi:hypothetical protein
MILSLKNNLFRLLEGHYLITGLLSFGIFFLALLVFFEGQDNEDIPTIVVTQQATRPPVIIEVIGTPTPTDQVEVAEKPSATPEPTPKSTPVSPESTVDPGSNEIYLPIYVEPIPPTATPTNTPEPTPTPTIDFRAVRAQLLQEGSELGFAKIGFHTGGGGNRNGLGVWMHRLDEAGVPFFIKTVDDSGPLVEAQEILQNSDVPHTLVFRRSGNEYDVPKYDLSPVEAAREHWELHKAAFPPELDPNIVWIETINEVDRNRSDWLGQFAVETARLAMADGFKWAAFGWSSGEPEVSDWQKPSMMQYLRMAGDNPDRLAIALHEYSYVLDEIAHDYPFKVGRFQQLFQVTDQAGIPRPTILITEWGWEYAHVPSQGKAIDDINWAAEMYADFPEIKGAALWYLGGSFGGIAELAQKLIKPVTEYSLGNYFAIPIPPNQAPINPEKYRP